VTSRRKRSLGVEKARLMVLQRSIAEALTGGNIDERKLELRAELGQVSWNIHIELRRSLVSLRYRSNGSAYIPFEHLRDPGDWIV